MVEISDWIQEELEKRDWTQADLCRAANISPGVLSTALARNRMGPDLARSIAKGLHLKESVVFYKIGLTTENPNEKLSSDQQEIVQLFDLLPADKKELARAMLNTLAASEKKKVKKG